MAIPEAVALVKELKIFLGIIEPPGFLPPVPPVPQPPNSPQGQPTPPGPTLPEPPPQGPVPSSVLPVQAPPVMPSPNSGKKGQKETLLVKVNITKLDYTETDLEEMRGSILKVPDGFSPQLPGDLKREIKLKKHQLIGLAWMQYLYSKAPNIVEVRY